MRSERTRADASGMLSVKAHKHTLTSKFLLAQPREGEGEKKSAKEREGGSHVENKKKREKRCVTSPCSLLCQP